jgi:hypothetical protein
MRFLILLFTIITLAFGAAVPITGGETDILAEIAPPDNTTDVTTQEATKILYPIVSIKLGMHT